MSDIKKYDNIRLESADNGIEVSFLIIKENDENPFEHRVAHHKEFVFENANLDKAFELIKNLVLFNMKRKKGESVDPVTLPT